MVSISVAMVGITDAKDTNKTETLVRIFQKTWYLIPSSYISGCHVTFTRKGVVNSAVVRSDRFEQRMKKERNAYCMSWDANYLILDRVNANNIGHSLYGVIPEPLRLRKTTLAQHGLKLTQKT